MELIILLSLLFLSASLFLFYRVNSSQLRNLILLTASTLFYSYWEKERILLLYLIIVFTWALGRLLRRKKSKFALCTGILLNVLILLCYKYFPFLNFNHLYVTLPIGLSFYTFQSISYLVDIYNTDTLRKDSWLEVANYLAFFPKILAGPIEKAGGFIAQLNTLPQFNKIAFFTAGKIILLALCCKYVIADRLGIVVDASLSELAQLSTLDILMTAGLYSFQIFFDFYAYSILAIGVGKLYGIHLSKNFNYPYFSSSVKEFWKRWNITLTSWLKEYIYIPLGGNKVSTFRWAVNCMIVFLISGCWHGGTLNYVIWGAGHGLCYVAEQYNARFVPVKIKRLVLVKVIYSIFVFLAISVLWIIFRIEDISLLCTLFNKLINPDVSGVQYIGGVYFVWVTLLLWYTKKSSIIDRYVFNTQSSVSFIIKEICLVNLLLIALFCFSGSGGSPFIYFKY